MTLGHSIPDLSGHCFLFLVSLIHMRLRKIILLSGDIVIFYLALWGALLIRHDFAVPGNLWSLHLPYFSWLFLGWLVIIYIADFYDLKNAKLNQDFFIRLAVALGAMTALAIAFFYIYPDLPISPKLVLIYDLILTAVLFLAWRAYFNHSITIPTSNGIMVGYSEASQKLAAEIASNPQWGFRIVAAYDPISQPTLAPLPVFNKLHELENIIANTKAELLIVNDELFALEELIDQLFTLLNKKVRIISLSKFYEQTAQKIPLASISKVWFLENQSEHVADSFDNFKRFADFILALLFLIITIPFFPLLMLAIKLDSPGPIFYRQKRMGKNGEIFWVIKFRSMVTDAEKNGAVWTTKGDPRVTRIGKWLRRTRLDELPQLMNILQGNMSFVGPRAERPEFTKTLAQELPFFQERLLVKPGLTGWAQVNYKYGESVADALEKLQYDLYYIKNRSLYLDLSIILKTIRIVLTGAGQ